MRRLIRVVPFVVSAFVVLGPVLAQAQTPKPAPTVRDVLLEHWSEIGEKVVKLAEEFPEDKYEFRPVAGVRTFGDQLRHVAFWNGFVAKNARGEKADGKQNELPKAEYATKASVVAALKSSLAEATALLKNGPATPSPKLDRSLGVVHRALRRALRPAGRLLPAQRHRASGLAWTVSSLGAGSWELVAGCWGLGAGAGIQRAPSAQHLAPSTYPAPSTQPLR